MLEDDGALGRDDSLLRDPTAGDGLPQQATALRPSDSDATKQLLQVRSGANELQAFGLRCLRSCKGFLTSAPRLDLTGHDEGAGLVLRIRQLCEAHAWNQSLAGLIRALVLS